MNIINKNINNMSIIYFMMYVGSCYCCFYLGTKYQQKVSKWRRNQR